MSAAIESLDPYYYLNWSGAVSCTPARYFLPKNTEEIKKILHEARKEDQEVRVSGCQHTSNPLPCTSGFMINLRHFNKLLEVDKEKHTVRVGAGMLVLDLNEILAEEGLSLSVQAAIASITIGGAIATSTHGSGATFGIMSSYVTAMEIMLASGEILEVTKDKDEDLFRAASLSLGCLGIIISVTLQCEPMFNLHAYNKILSEEEFQNIDGVIEGSEHSTLLWFPDSKKFIAVYASRTEKDINLPKASWLGGQIRKFLEYLYWICFFLPFLVPFVNKLYYKIMFSQPVDLVARSYHVFNIDMLFQSHANEWFIPREHLHKAITEIEILIQNMSDKVHLPFVIRFISKDDILLSPAHGRDSVAFQILRYKPLGKEVPFGEYWEGFEKIMKKYNGRPHWAKFHGPLNEGDYSSMYPKWNTFKDIRRKIDPTGLFLNSYLKNIFNE